MMDHIDLAMQVALRLHGQPYSWGGDDTMVGFDCSGLMIEILKSVGMLPRAGDWNAHSLMNDHSWPVAETLERGCLVFWGKEGKATHVEMIYARIGGNAFTVGASGGGKKTDNLQQAILHNAYVKIRPLRAGYFAVRDPFDGVRV